MDLGFYDGLSSIDTSGMLNLFYITETIDTSETNYYNSENNNWNKYSRPTFLNTLYMLYCNLKQKTCPL